jgi:uncharacterized protein
VDILAAIIFTVLYGLGVIGIIAPVLPSTPLIAVGAVIYGFMTGFERLSVGGVVWVVALALVAQVADYLTGMVGARRYGASTAGVWGGIIGSLLGLVVFPPFGFLPGALLGAVAAELLANRGAAEAMRSGWGTLLGTLAGVVIKVVIVIAIGVIVFPRFF